MKPPLNSDKYVPYLVPALLLLFGYGLYLIRFGYGYGASDQDEFIPYLLSLIDPSLFQTDWFVQTQSAAFSVRTYFVYLLRTISFVMPVWLAVLTIYLISWSSIVLALYKLAERLTHNRLAAVASVAIICIMTPFWTLGGNDIIHSMLVPSMSAWAIGLWAFVFFLRNLDMPAAIMAGLATLLQALVGIQIMLLLGGLLCFKIIRLKENPIKSLIKPGLMYVLVAGAALIPLFYQQLTSEVNESSTGPSLFYIMALFRNPHHYLFYSFDKVHLVQFFLLLLTGYFALLYKQRTDRSFRSEFFNHTLTLVFVFCLIGYLGTEINPSLLIAKLQLFKMTILIKVLMVIVLSAAFIQLLPGKLTTWLDHLTFEQPLWLSAIFLSFVLAVMAAQPGRLNQKVYPFSENDSPMMQIAQWAQTNTTKNEVFAIPPSWSNFRSHALRGIVINHKAFPYRDSDIPIWFTRLTDMAPIKTPDRADAALLSTLDKQYNAALSHDLERLSHKYGFDYVIRNTPLPGSSSFSILHEEQGWYLYEVSPQRLAFK